MGFGQKLGWEMGFRQNLGWEMGFIPPPSGPSTKLLWVNLISIRSGSGLQGDDFRAPGSKAKNIQGSRHRNERAPGSTAKISGLQGPPVWDPEFAFRKSHLQYESYSQLTIGSCLECVYRVMDARGKFAEHERSARAARNVAESNSSFLSALQTSRVHP